MCLIKGPVRWCGFVIFSVGFALAVVALQPDVLIERTANNIAVRNDSGELVLANARRSRFAAERWLLADGDSSTPAGSAVRQGFDCADHLCIATVKNKRVAFADKSAEGKLQCPRADVLIAAFPLRGACKSIPLRIDRFDVWRKGAHALYLNDDAIRVETSQDARGNRPWVVEPKPRKAKSADGPPAKVQ